MLFVIEYSWVNSFLLIAIFFDVRASLAGDPDLNPGGGLTRVTPKHE